MARIIRDYVKNSTCHRGRLFEMPDRAIRAQLYDILVEIENNQAWSEVFSKPDFLDDVGHWEATRQDRGADANPTGIDLGKRTVDFDVLACGFHGMEGSERERRTSTPSQGRLSTALAFCIRDNEASFLRLLVLLNDCLQPPMVAVPSHRITSIQFQNPCIFRSNVVRTPSIRVFVGRRKARHLLYTVLSDGICRTCRG